MKKKFSNLHHVYFNKMMQERQVYEKKLKDETKGEEVGTL